MYPNIPFEYLKQSYLLNEKKRISLKDIVFFLKDSVFFIILLAVLFLSIPGKKKIRDISSPAPPEPEKNCEKDFSEVKLFIKK